MSSKPPLTLDELKLTPEWIALTPKMKVFVRAYIESEGDILAAVQEAYSCKGGREEKIVKWQIMRHPKILAALEIWSQRDEKEIFVDHLKSLFRQKEVPVEKVRVMELYARMMGWDITPEQIKAMAVENGVKVKALHERNISTKLAREERRKQRKEERRLKKEAEPKRPQGRPPKEPDAVDYGLDIYEAQADGDQGNRSPGE